MLVAESSNRKERRFLTSKLTREKQRERERERERERGERRRKVKYKRIEKEKKESIVDPPSDS